MSILGAHHVSFSVTDIEKTVHFYRDVLGLSLRSRSQNEYEGLGTALFGTKWASTTRTRICRSQSWNLAGSRIEFIQYKDPASQPYHMNPSIAGSAHLAIRVDDIVAERKRLEGLGVEFPRSDKHLQRDRPARVEMVLLPGSRWDLPRTRRV